jgi:hypothetical protein
MAGEGRWIPSFLPRSSRYIVETHDIDTHTSLRSLLNTLPAILGACRLSASALCQLAPSQNPFQCCIFSRTERRPIGVDSLIGEYSVSLRVRLKSVLEHRTRDTQL